MDLNFVQIDGSSFAKRRKFGNGACVRCHERKVKCDPNASGPCRNCLASGHGESCRSHRDGRMKASNAAAQPQKNAEVLDRSNSHISSDVQLDQQIQSSEVIDFNLTPESIPSTGDDGPSSYSSQGELGQSHETSINGGDFSLIAFASDQFDHAFMTSDTTFSNDNAVRSRTANTSPQVPDPVVRPPRSTKAAALSLNRFEAYVEDTLGSYAPSFRNSHGMPEGRQATDNIPEPWQAEHPFRRSRGPSHILPLEVNMASRSTIDLEHQVVRLDSADMEYLKAKGAFDLPPRALQEDLVEAFFADVHPTAPVINKAEFLSEFYGKGSPSRLLLFAMFTSGSRACRNPALLDSKGTNQGSAQQFYKATKALLDTGYEPNRLVCVQSLLLLTWWWDKKDDGGKNMRSCAVDAINIAHSIGMHRWDHYPKNDIVLARLWKRIWWTCFNRDVAVAVSHGLPCLLSQSEFDVHPLNIEDFNEQPDIPIHLQRWTHQPVEVDFSIGVIKVAEALHYIHSAHFVTQHLQPSMAKTIAERESGLATLMELGHNVPPPGSKGIRPLPLDQYDDVGLKLCRQWLETVPLAVTYNVDDVQNHQFWPAFLHILYLTNVMLRFRERAVSHASEGRAEAERVYCQTRGIAAATMISKILRNARAHNHILRFTGQLTITLFNCLIYLLIEGQSPNQDVRRDAQAKYSSCLHILYEFSQLWVSASLVHRLFETLQAHMQIPRSTGSANHASNQFQTPLPGLAISSDITNSYFESLMMAEFHFESSTTAPSLTQATSTHVSPQGDLNQFLDQMSHDSPDLSLPLGGGLPDTLDVEKWINFFGLGDGAEDQSQMYM